MSSFMFVSDIFGNLLQDITLPDPSLTGQDFYELFFIIGPNLVKVSFTIDIHILSIYLKYLQIYMFFALYL